MNNRILQHQLPILCQRITQHPKYNNPRTRPKDLRYNPNYNSPNIARNQQISKILLVLLSIEGPFCKFLLQQPNIRKSLVQCKKKISCTCQQFADDPAKPCIHIQFISRKVLRKAQKKQNIQIRRGVNFQEMESILTVSVENALRFRGQILKKNQYSLHKFFLGFEENQFMEQCLKKCNICLVPVEQKKLQLHPQYVKGRDKDRSNQNNEFCLNCNRQFHARCHRKWLQQRWRNHCPVCSQPLKVTNKSEYRIQRGLRQRMFLIGFKVQTRQSSFTTRKLEYNQKNPQPFETLQQWDFLIVDSTLYRQFKVTVNSWNIKCDCRDSKQNLVCCKHIFFLAAKISNKRSRLERKLKQKQLQQNSFYRVKNFDLIPSFVIKKLINGFKRRLKHVISCQHNKNFQKQFAKQQQCTQDLEVQKKHLVRPFQICLICFQTIANDSQIYPKKYQSNQDASFITKINCENGDEYFHENCLQIWRYKLNERYKINNLQSQICPYCCKLSYKFKDREIFESKQSTLAIQQSQIQFNSFQLSFNQLTIKKQQQDL